MADSNLVRLTGLWQNQSKQGESYLVGSISPSSRLLIFPNKRKQRDRGPDFIAYIAPQEREDKPNQQPSLFQYPAGQGRETG